MTVVRYLGSFPPPYGGVTVKNNLLFEELSNQVTIYRKLGKNKVINEIKNIIDIIFWNGPFIVGISASRGKSALISKWLYLINKKSMRKSLYFMMGGLEAGDIAKDNIRLKQYAKYKRIYVETNSMAQSLKGAGLCNVAVFPNCRKRPLIELNIKENTEARLKCVFFSNIQRVKGVNVILEVAEQLQNVDFYFYGYIEDGYSEEFNRKIGSIKNAFYKGVFKGKTEEAIKELNEFDVLLFPTQWKNEGVPGVLVEGKIAGLSEIVTNICYNAEIVKDGVEGILIEPDSAESLQEAIEALDNDREKLQKLKENSQKSAERFYIDNYVDDIIKLLKQ